MNGRLAWTAYALFTPVVRHMLGIQPDAARGEVLIRPCLPKKWTDVSIHNVRVLDGEISVHIIREGGKMRTEVSGTPGLCVRVIQNDSESVRCSNNAEAWLE